jgi:ectoine hydroxylase-related dioxygenase (phytanoyl-CoA dioxygenase family)
VSLDRASMKPPVNPQYPAWEHPPFLHWDVDLKECPIKFGLQGVLCLSDSTADHGGFHCIPGMHRDTIEWSRAPPGDRDVNTPPHLDGQKVRAIEAKAGDLIIWHSALPHGSGVNRTDRPRLAQFILCAPAGFAVSGPHAIDDSGSALYERLRRQRIAQWERRVGPLGRDLDPRELGPPAHLTPLGRRLLGLDMWE